MKKVVLGLFLVLGLAIAQTNLETLFTQSELQTLEQLVSLAQANDAKVLEASLALEGTEMLGRLSEALTVNAGVGLSGDFYGQAAPKYSITISLDVMTLVDGEDTNLAQSKIESEKNNVRVRTVEAFVNYKVAVESAQSAALSVESATATFNAIHARVEMGEATRTDQLQAQQAVSGAAIGLLEANGQVIVALENLAAVVGAAPAEIVAILEGSNTLAAK
jgi:outer membrane protein TolC